MNTAQALHLLQRFESRNVTFIESNGSWPIVWERAQGMYVTDPEGKRYLDLTAAFGVAATGHANARLVRAGRRQMGRLLHAMGDVHPHALKARLARELSALTFERWKPGQKITGKTIFCNSGFEAVEAALKTSRLSTGKPGVIVFEGGYHGLGYGALNATHRKHFRGPFRDQLREFGCFVPFPTGKAAGAELASLETQIKSVLRRKSVGALLVEPIQVRGGINIPPEGFLPMLRRVCTETGLVLILDEIYTGFGRTGSWFACEHTGVAPDLICLGKALAGGFPLSACVGRADLMDQAWPPATGEAIHTSTFLGHPVGCAMALAQIAEIRSTNLVERSRTAGAELLHLLQQLAEKTTRSRLEARGIGLLAGLEFSNRDRTPATPHALAVVKQLLHRGFILLPEGEFSNVISFTPPLTISKAQIHRAVGALSSVLETL